jgi:hypothetical protein
MYFQFGAVPEKRVDPTLWYDDGTYLSLSSGSNAESGEADPAEPAPEESPNQNLDIPKGHLRLYRAGTQYTPEFVKFEQGFIATDEQGKSPAMQVSVIQGERYDVVYKSWAHLVRIKRDVLFDGESVFVDLTNEGNDPLFVGDINLEYGDNKVNAIDASILTNEWGNAGRADLNGDNEVNAIDMSNLLANFNKEGEPWEMPLPELE